ncbi:hypothetical protein [Hymenobacter qilianensis]|uniref:IPT/TIG domain-containing protein n=1 Tax=Hymenobacter qilianensis TaxID=1385715 RepID=A0A7H0H179_9BACT|nr:hypothetical protein [Hymenobacter qilianensis]QNP54295.1 hypothetical protein H9L05_20915 [Hymenobacter qilianensis]
MSTSYPLAATRGPGASPARLPRSARHQRWPAKRSGTAWSTLSTGENTLANALAVNASVNGYAGGSFTAGGDGVEMTAYFGIYQDNMPLPTLTALSASRGVASRLLRLTGTGLRGVTAVTFTSARTAINAPAGFVASATRITGVVVPAGLAPGAYAVTVTTAGGTSNGLPLTVTGPTPTPSRFMPANGVVAITLPPTGTTAIAFDKTAAPDPFSFLSLTPHSPFA